MGRDEGVGRTDEGVTGGRTTEAVVPSVLLAGEEGSAGGVNEVLFP